MKVSVHALSSLVPVNHNDDFGSVGDLCTRQPSSFKSIVVGMIVGIEERRVSDGRGGRLPLTYAWVLWSDNPKIKYDWSWFTSDTVVQISRRLEDDEQEYKLPLHYYVVKSR